MRKLIAAAVGIALFAAAGVAVVWVLTREGPRSSVSGPPPAEAVGSAAPVERVAPAPLGALPTGPAPAEVQPAPQIVYGPPRIEPPSDSWEAVAIAARPSALGPLGGAIGRGLNELQPRLAACFDEYTAARYGPQPRSVSRDPSLPESGTPVLVLQIETGGGEARIVDAPVDTQGGVEDGVISCAQAVLRGQRFPAPQAPPGGKYRMLHALIR